MAEKKLPDSTEIKRAMIKPDHSTLSIRRQCELIGLNRTTYHSEPAGESPFNLLLMSLIDDE